MPTGVYKHRPRHPFSEDTRRKMSLAHLGRPRSEETKRKVSEGNKGKIITKEVRDKIAQGMSKYRELNPPKNKGKKMSEDFCHQIRVRQLGEKNQNWKGGVSKENNLVRASSDYRIWRKAVFERDGYRCLICAKVGGKLNVHHLRKFSKYPELRFDENNGITLCEDCHKIKHKKTGEEL